MRHVDMQTKSSTSPICIRCQNMKQWTCLLYWYSVHILYVINLVIVVFNVYFVHFFAKKWYKEALKRIQSYKFHFLMVENIWFDTKIIQIGPENPVLWQNMCFLCQKWRPSWKIAAILKIQVANGFSLISCPRRTFMQILVLVSGFERFLQLSASLEDRF